METHRDGQLTFLEAWATHQNSMETQRDGQLTFPEAWATHQSSVGSSGKWEQLGMGVLHQPKVSTKIALHKYQDALIQRGDSIQPKIHFSHPLTLPSFPKHSIQPQNHQKSSKKPSSHFSTNLLFLCHHQPPKLIPNLLFSCHTLDVRNFLERH
ncbi:unnamed protein product [Prunus brigantina]